MELELYAPIDPNRSSWAFGSVGTVKFKLAKVPSRGSHRGSSHNLFTPLFAPLSTHLGLPPLRTSIHTVLWPPGRFEGLEAADEAQQLLVQDARVVGAPGEGGGGGPQGEG